VVQLPRGAGSREARWAHLLCGPVDVSTMPLAAEDRTAPEAGLAARVAALENEVAELRALFTDVAAQLGLSPPGHPESNDRA
jgi:uncharacterized protein